MIYQALHRLSKPLAVAVLGLSAAGAASAAVMTFPPSVLSPSPGVYTAGGYYTDVLGPNIVATDGLYEEEIGDPQGRTDDGSMELALGFNFTFYGMTYDRVFINNNGNVSFGNSLLEYNVILGTDPLELDSPGVPLIAPWFGDVDTRHPDSGVVHYRLTGDELVVTWDAVDSFDQRGGPFNSFQLVLRSDARPIADGEGVIGFFYRTMDWEVTDTIDVALVGFSDGSDWKLLDGSGEPGLNRVVENRYVWFDAGLNPVTVGGPPVGLPAPATGGLALLALAGVALTRRRVR